MFLNGPVQCINVFVENSLYARDIFHSLVLLSTHLKNPIPFRKILYILEQHCVDFELSAIKLTALLEVLNALKKKINFNSKS